jgi:hypothetical protein
MLGLAGILLDYRQYGAESSPYVVAGAWFIYRGSKSASVSVGEEGVVTVSMLRTRRYGWSEIASAAVGRGTTGLNGHDREYVVIQRVNGSLVSFRELNAKAAEGGQEINEVRRAVSAINSRTTPP